MKKERDDQLKYAINMPNFVFSPNPEVIADLATVAERAGWDGFFLWDHLINGPEYFEVEFLDPIVTLSVIALKTATIKFGTMITPLPRRRPWKVAREMVSLDHLSQGRLILGVGLGYPPFEYTAFAEKIDLKIRAKKLEESLAILQGLWSGETFSFSGKYYTVKEVKFSPPPYNNHIPIYVGGSWPNRKPFKRGAQYDGIVPIRDNYPQPFTPSEITTLIEYTKQHRRKKEPLEIMMGGGLKDMEQDNSWIKELQDLGVTWWSLTLSEWEGTLEEVREIIRNGPPEIL